MAKYVRPISYPECPIHEVTCNVPQMNERDYKYLLKSISDHGLFEPIVLDKEGKKIIDGRYRYMACRELGVEPKFRTWNGPGDMEGYVLSRDLIRPNYTRSQMAIVARKYIAIARKRKLATDSSLPDKANDELIKKTAEMCDISASTVRHAIALERHGVPELDRAVCEGHISVSAAAVVAANCSREEQLKILSQGNQAVAAAAKRILETQKVNGGSDRRSPESTKQSLSEVDIIIQKALAAPYDITGPCSWTTG